MGFEMCGQRVDAKADICVMERSGTSAKYIYIHLQLKGLSRLLKYLGTRCGWWSAVGNDFEG